MLEPISIFLIIFFVFLFTSLITLSYCIPLHKKHQQVSNSVVNYNSTCTKYVYRLPMNKAEIERQLSLQPTTLDPCCHYDKDTAILTLSEQSPSISKISYQVSIQECPDFSIVRLKQIRQIGKGYIYLKLNPFFVEKMDAEIIPYSMYGI